MNDRIAKIRSKFQSSAIDGLLITSSTNRRYTSGFTGSTGHVLLGESKSIFITDFRYTEQAEQECFGFEVVDNKRNAYDALAEQVKRLGIKRLGFEKNHVTYAEYERLKDTLGNLELVPISGLIEEIRAIKEPGEIEIIRKACEIADKAFMHIINYIRPGVRETEIALELETFMRKQGATSSSFDMIVASGARSALPHGRASEKTIEHGDLVTLDFGAYYQGYASDITRTVAVGEISAQFKEIYDVVLKAQLAGVNHIKAGMTAKEADALCREIIAAAGYGPNFGHATGHGLGMDVHESPTLSFASEATLLPGMVVTVEPGIYLPGMGGVRIEDDIVITENGNENLCSSTKELLIL